MITSAEIDALVAGLDRARRAWISGQLEHVAMPELLQDDETVLFGPFGAVARGPVLAELQARAVRLFQGGEGRCERVAAWTSGDLVGVALIEHNEVRLAGQERPVRWSLRTTQLFRKVSGGWLRLHRHADPLSDRHDLETIVKLMNE